MSRVRDDIQENQIAFSVYLFIACIANGAFLFKSVRDLRLAPPGSAYQGGAHLMLGAAITELVWVLPCFVQCALYIVLTSDNQTGKAACDVQGYYSTVSSLSSMLVAPLLSWFTLECLIKGAPCNMRRTKMLVAACLLGTAAFGFLPSLPGVRDHMGYAAMGEGFCYWDLEKKSVAAILLVMVTGLITFMFALNGRALFALDRDAAEFKAKAGTLIALMLTYSITWMPWPVASIITLSGKTFPTGLMISGGALGHAQALVNPLLYGVFWRRHFLEADADRYASKVRDVSVESGAQGP